MDLNELSGNERIIAEQAVLVYQAIREASHNAEHGHGMAAMEQVIAAKGFEPLRKLLEVSRREHAEAQKKGSVAKAVRATPRSAAAASSLRGLGPALGRSRWNGGI